MIISRGARILKTACHFNKVKTAAINLNLNRFSHGEWYYRRTPDPQKIHIIIAEITAGVAWWWFLWNMYHEFDVLLKGEIPAPIPEHWTDEELGIFPDK
ncbi:NADH dehydrogenase (ubiquinone) 1 beta subcomplex, 2, 8kDa [Ptiloglossa arizonensis]|uniref:NADH dehydrogenase (ubiquinone) 1 beta subcomplex, 2, 8kDa n=1 Tax=Ptiloglossa arizonensis TaxID=3350558 RepID=UPI003F9FA07E